MALRTCIRSRARRRRWTSTPISRSLPAGRYRVYGDIVHESGYAQTLVGHVEIGASSAGTLRDPDDSWFAGKAASETAAAAFDLADGSRVTWRRGEAPLVAGAERVLAFDVRDAAGTILPVEPYMGMAAHVAVASRDGEVFAHLHPSGSISMAAQEKLTGANADAHAGHTMTLDGSVAIPYAFPRPGPYRLWVQFKRGGQVMTAAFDAHGCRSAAEQTNSRTSGCQKPADGVSTVWRGL